MVIEKQKLKDRKKEIEDLMQILMTRYDLLSKKEFHVKMEQLQIKHKEIENAIANGNEEELIRGM